MVESLVHARARVCGEGVYMYMYVVSLAHQPLTGKERLESGLDGLCYIAVAAESA